MERTFRVRRASALQPWPYAPRTVPVRPEIPASAKSAEGVGRISLSAVSQNLRAVERQLYPLCRRPYAYASFAATYFFSPGLLGLFGAQQGKVRIMISP